MLKCYIDDEYLINYEPEILNFLWAGQTDFSSFITSATSIVFADMNKLSSDSRYIMPELILRSSGSTSSSASVTGTEKLETINRNRIVIIPVTVTGYDKTLTFKGSNDNVTYSTISEYTLTTSDSETQSYVFNEVYNYYRIDFVQTSGTVDFTCYLVESVYDNIFAYKTLELIFSNQKKDERYKEISEMYKTRYNELIKSLFIYEDKNKDGYPEVN